MARATSSSGFHEAVGDRVVVPLTFSRPVEVAWRCSVLEDREDELDVRDRRVVLVLRPFELVTIRARWAR